MPELPEVEVTRLGLANALCQRSINEVIIRQTELRWSIPKELPTLLQKATISGLARRGKYLLLQLHQTPQQIIIHLGMSGHLRLLSQWQTPQKHDHIDLELDNQHILRYTDPRRFGCWLLGNAPIEDHPLLSHLGPEPLQTAFNASYLWHITRNRTIAIKNLIMQQSVVVGIGNIYASEILFNSGIRPDRPSHSLTLDECDNLVKASQSVLTRAIEVGGTSLRDFFSADGKPGYFSLSLAVYNRHNQKCLQCNSLLQLAKINQRQSVFCPKCQL